MKPQPCEPCGKQAYPSRLQAIGAALHSSQRSGIALRVYKCPARKGFFHLTKRAEWEARDAA
jgi:hypothetical protein